MYQNLSKIRDLINSSNLKGEEKDYLLQEYVDIFRSFTACSNDLLILVKALQNTTKGRQTDRVYSEFNHLKKIMSCRKEVDFSKFDPDELENPYILTAVMKNIFQLKTISEPVRMDWCFLKGCILIFLKSNEYSRDLSGFLDFMNELYELSSKDSINHTETFVKFMDDRCDEDTRVLLKPYWNLAAEERQKRVLTVLNHVKGYYNTGEESYVIIHDNSLDLHDFLCEDLKGELKKLNI